MLQLLETDDSNLWMSEPLCVWIKERCDDVHPILGQLICDLFTYPVNLTLVPRFFRMGFAPLGVRLVTKIF